MRNRDDLVDERTSLRMKRVRRQNTAPELAVRKILSANGYRYRLHRNDLPGTPDVVFAGRRKVVFVHGCFWHGHANCVRGSLPERRALYWQDRIRKNQERDLRTASELRRMGWSICVVWECETRDSDALTRKLIRFLLGSDKKQNLAGPSGPEKT